MARSMSLNIEKVWQNVDGTVVLVPLSRICEGDLVTVHVGSVIPLDGIVVTGFRRSTPISTWGRLAAVICIIDPLREEAASVVSQLRKPGLSKIVMMT